MFFNGLKRVLKIKKKMVESQISIGYSVHSVVAFEK